MTRAECHWRPLSQAHGNSPVRVGARSLCRAPSLPRRQGGDERRPGGPLEKRECLPVHARRRAVIRAATRIGCWMQTSDVSSEVAGPVQLLLDIEYNYSGRRLGQLGSSSAGVHVQWAKDMPMYSHASFLTAEQRNFGRMD